MKKTSFIFLFILTSFISLNFLWSDTPMISANGFSCVKAQLLVTCEGQFPGVAGNVGASGNYGVQIIFETPVAPKIRNIYDSTTGCLMQISMSPMGIPFQAFVKNASGAKQTFTLPSQQMPAYNFCRIQSGPSQAK